MSNNLADERPRRILHIGKYFPPHRGGMETVLRDQMNMQVRDEGLKVAAVVHSSERRFTDNVEITELGYRIRRSARWFTAIFAPISPFFWWSVIQEIRELDPDEIKIHMPNLSAFWLLLLPSARCRKWVILWHSDVLASPHSWGLRALYWLYRPLEVALLRRANKVIATSPPYLESSQPLQPFRGKCEVEPLKLDEQRFPIGAGARQQPGRKADEGIRLLCVGRLTYYKDFGTAIKAVAATPNAQLRIVGEGEEADDLKRLAAKLSDESRIKFLGDIDDKSLWQEYLWCDALCLPSIERTEAFGLVILEARLFGKPSLVANTPGSGMAWVAAASHECSHSFEAGDPQALASLLSDIPISHTLPSGCSAI